MKCFLRKLDFIWLECFSKNLDVVLSLRVVLIWEIMFAGYTIFFISNLGFRPEI